MDLSIDKIGSQLDKFLSTKTVVGDPIIVGKVSLVPIQRASFGFGSGGGETAKESSSGGGVGAGASLTPVAIVAVKDDGQVQVYSIGKKGAWEHLIEMLPEVVSKIDLSNLCKKKDPEPDKNKEDTEGKGE